MKKLINIFRYILGLPKTIYFNFRYFSPCIAIKLPVVVSHKTILKEMRGSIKLDKVKTGMIRIGFGSKENMDFRYTRTIFRNRGELIFKGKTKFGYGSVISNEGKIIFGENNNFGMTTFICRKKITIGDSGIFSWNTFITDTDHHHIYLDGKKINEDREIKIGSRIWMGTNANILKGSIIKDDTIIALGTTISKAMDKGNIIIGNNNAIRVIKENINWQE